MKDYIKAFSALPDNLTKLYFYYVMVSANATSVFPLAGQPIGVGYKVAERLLGLWSCARLSR
jgi:hypothetical protein